MLRLIITAVFVVLFLIFSLVLVLAEVILGKTNPGKKDRLAYHVIQWAFRQVLWINGVKLEVRGRENLPEPGTAVLYVSNHRSYFDIICAYTVVPDLTGFVAKKEMSKVPIFSLWMKYIHCLFLDRDDIRAGLKTILEGVEKMKNGVSLWICPEGTRNRVADCTQMLEFKAGSFKLAEKSGCPVIPVAISGTAEIWELHLPWLRPSDVVIEFGKPIRMEELDKEARKRLAEDTQERIHEMLVRQKAERA